MKLNLQGGSLLWLRRDLRIMDNNLVKHAISKRKKMFFCFVFDNVILEDIKSSPFTEKDDKSLYVDRRVGFIHNTLAEIKKDLQQIGSDLLIFYGDPVELIPKIAITINAGTVLWTKDYEQYARRRDDKISTSLESLNINPISIKNQCIFEESEVLTNDGNPYTVFTPYKKKWLTILGDSQNLWEGYSVKQLSECAAKVDFPEDMPELEEFGFSSMSKKIKIKSGSDGAEELVKDFFKVIETYEFARNFPAKKGVSYLSTHFRFGTLSVEKIVHTLLKLIPEFEEKRTNTTGIHAWLSELIWRDFYMQILFHFPHVESSCFKKKYDNLVWEDDSELFHKWTVGQTGYPIVDAGMRQLNETGYMHNRLRMVTASFLTKDLGINWQEGERYFANKLLDFDLSANNGGWQWAASTGCDAQPYFRIFNPTSQAKKFDPDGEFIKKYVGELRELPRKLIFEPWKITTLVEGEREINYTKRIIDHDEARKKTLKRFLAISENNQ